MPSKKNSCKRNVDVFFLRLVCGWRWTHKEPLQFSNINVLITLDSLTFSSARGGQSRAGTLHRRCQTLLSHLCYLCYGYDAGWMRRCPCYAAVTLTWVLPARCTFFRLNWRPSRRWVTSRQPGVDARLIQEFKKANIKTQNGENCMRKPWKLEVKVDFNFWMTSGK